MGHEESGMGRYEDKILKNLLVINKTPGIEDLECDAVAGDDGNYMSMHLALLVPLHQ